MGFFQKNDELNDSEHIEQDFHEEVEVTLEDDRVITVESDEEKRERRRKNRAKTEMIVYLSTFLALVVLSGAVFAGISSIRKFINNGQSSEESVATESTDNIQNLVDSMLASESELPTEVVEVVSPEEQLDEYIDTVLAGMTLEEKVAGLFITSPEELTGVATATRAGESTKTAIQKMPVGGLVYYRKNMQSKEQLTEMLTNISGYSKYPLFLAVNEGGDSSSSVQNSAISVPDVTKPGEIKSAEEAYALGSTIGGYLAELKFNVSFAPTADILYEANSPVADYCFGGDSATNSQFVSEFVRGLEEKGVSAAVKTFPGTAYLTASTTQGTVGTERDRDSYEPDIQVFKAGIEAGADFVMVSNIVASELSGGMDPCSMSSTVVTGILRNELQYDGIIITEPMNVKAITDYYSAAEAAVAALKAGCDMILLPEDLKEAYEGILTGIIDGSVAQERINDSLKRVYRVKYAYKLQEFTN